MPLEGKPLVLLGESDKELDVVLAGILKLQGLAVIVANTSGADEFVQKPVTPDTIATKIMALMAKR
jgi:hypothetical protein